MTQPFASHASEEVLASKASRFEYRQFVVTSAHSRVNENLFLPVSKLHGLLI